MCGVPEQVGSKDNHLDWCPPECPFRVEDVGASGYCNFRCVTNSSQCGAINPDTTVEDRAAGICRACQVKGCDVCAHDGTDSCARCLAGYRMVGGTCVSGYRRIWLAVFLAAGVVAVFVCLWFLDLWCREPTNMDALNHGLQHRSASKIRMPSGGGVGDLWPLFTNLLRTDIAGEGMMLHFNFQLMVVAWGLLVASAWVIFALTYDEDMLVLGTQPAESPRMYCILVSWGWESQQRLMWVKVVFVACVYLGTFILSLIFSVHQLRLYRRLDSQEATMKDYAALCEGLPRSSGAEPVEEELRELFAAETGVGVVGVSVCWDVGDRNDELVAAAEWEVEVECSRQASPRACEITGEAMASPAGSAPFWRRMLFGIEAKVLGVSDATADAEESTAPRADRAALLSGLQSTGSAFVIFETERERDIAVETVKSKGGVRCGEGTAHLTVVDCEPDTILWNNFSWPQGWLAMCFRATLGLGEILLALALWTLLFYLPYAHFMLAFNYKNGTEPGLVTGLSLTLVVVIGNNVMYAVCADVAARIHFRFSDDSQAAYMGLYFIACLFNVFVDLAVTYEIAHAMMVGAGVRTHDGTPLADLPPLDIFETYAMQRELGNQLWMYAFPSTFLFPFLGEPIATVLLPYWLQSLLVRTHPEVKRIGAEKALSCMDMDLSRYADILLNVGLAALTFFFPGGYVVQMFVALALCHVYIYVYDHLRVLRSVKKCDFASMDVDQTAQLLISVPTGFLLSCVIFKANCQEGLPCERGNLIYLHCVAAFAAHVIVHCLLIVYVVPLVGSGAEHGLAEAPYRETGSRNACSWFSVNPVHCLRSQHIYKHSPPCRYFMPGKEHVMQVNEAARSYFTTEGKRASAEDFNWHRHLSFVAHLGNSLPGKGSD